MHKEIHWILHQMYDLITRFENKDMESEQEYDCLYKRNEALKGLDDKLEESDVIFAANVLKCKIKDEETLIRENDGHLVND